MTALDQAFIKAYSREREPRQATSTTTAAGHEPWVANAFAPEAAPAMPAPLSLPTSPTMAPALRFDFGAGAVPVPMGPIWPWNQAPAPHAAPQMAAAPGYAPAMPRINPSAPAINPSLPAWGPWNDHGPWSPAVPQMPPAAPPRFEPEPEFDLGANDTVSYCGMAEADLDEPYLALGPVIVQSTYDEEAFAPKTTSRGPGPQAKAAPSIAQDPCCVPRDQAEAIVPLPTLAVAPLAWEPTHEDRSSDLLPAKEPRFQPQWEVEQFAWPAACDRLVASEDAAFAGLLERIVLSAVPGEKIVAVAGCSAGDGKSTLTLCLAREAARAGLSVALVDADFDHPQLADILGVAPPRGWEESLLGELPLVETSIASAVDGVHLFPLQSDRGAPDEEGQAALVEALELLAERHDLVLVDMGTIPADEETLPAPPAKHLLSAILLRDCRHVDESHALRIAQQLRAAGVEVLGRVDNFR